jgi:hypothetical protein
MIKGDYNYFIRIWVARTPTTKADEPGPYTAINAQAATHYAVQQLYLYYAIVPVVCCSIVLFGALLASGPAARSDPPACPLALVPVSLPIPPAALRPPWCLVFLAMNPYSGIIQQVSCLILNPNWAIGDLMRLKLLKSHSLWV